MYKAIVTQTEFKKEDTYIGITENHFKMRYVPHYISFGLPHKRSTTTLREHLWKPKDATASKDYTIKLTIIDKTKPFLPALKKCDLYHHIIIIKPT